MQISLDKDTVNKFDVPGPRYTSYPTAPVWSGDVNDHVYRQKLQQFAKSKKTLSIYVHLPFCRTMCSFCACNVIIRPADPKYADEYLGYLFKEIDLVVKNVGKGRKVLQLHLGGGTPNFLSDEQLERLFVKLKQNFLIDPKGEIAIELDPRTIDHEKLKHLRKIGFNRVSMGVQDFDPQVQLQVNRIQPYEKVKLFYGWCRDLGFDSINFDLIYGLPRQTIKTFQDTISKVIGLRPDRIALYSFAYVPWVKKHQQKIPIELLPNSDQKLDIFLHAREAFLSSGYVAIAMDHFAVPEDELSKSFNKGNLYRNFMGYTLRPADDYIGFGLTSIGFLEDSFVQNEKILSRYYDSLSRGELPIERGKVLDRDDLIRQWTIRALMCEFKVDKNKFHEKFQVGFEDYFIGERDRLAQSFRDGLIYDSPSAVEVTDIGRLFIRNVCMVFDKYLHMPDATSKFSRTI